ncbi:hypothetical protein JXQ31_17535 [candidate division KSB1 bacterium]|nr:hypothetical protein [candidate division KSB1 bacterium]
MGQQQLLILLLVLILVSIAIFVGIDMFKSWADTSNLEGVTNDLLFLANRAQEYYIKPVAMGGGGYSFERITIQDITDRPENENGAYSVVSVSSDKLILKGEGNRDADQDGTNCIVRVNIFSDSVGVEFLNK